MLVRDLTFSEDNAEHIAFIFGLVATNRAALIENYVQNGYTFYDRKQFFCFASRFTLKDRPEDLISYVNTSSIPLKWNCSDGIIDESPGCTLLKVLDEPTIVSCIKHVDFLQSLPFLSVEFVMNILNDLKAHLRRQKMFLDLGGVSETLPIPDISFPTFLTEPSELRNLFFANRLYLTSTEPLRSRLAKHIALYLGSLVIQARLETFIFFEKNRNAIKRLFSEIRSRDPLSRLDASILQKELLRLSRFSEVPYKAWAIDQAILCLIDKTSEPSRRPGEDFELECLSELQKHGFQAYLTGASSDYGADIIAEKSDLSYCIQCKDLTRPVGIKAVQEVVAAQKKYSCDFAVLVSRSIATQPAAELARSNGVAIIDLDQIKGLEFLVM